MAAVYYFMERPLMAPEAHRRAGLLKVVLGRGRPQWAPQGHTAANRGLWLTAANARTREAMALRVVCMARKPLQGGLHGQGSTWPGLFPWPWYGVGSWYP